MRAKTILEFEELAHEDATMTTAKRTLEDLSLDPQARRIAYDRETAFVAHQHLMAASREAGYEAGREEGRAEGRVAGLMCAIESMCLPLGIELDAQRTALMARLDLEQLQVLVDRLRDERQWPDW